MREYLKSEQELLTELKATKEGLTSNEADRKSTRLNSSH